MPNELFSWEKKPQAPLFSWETSPEQTPLPRARPQEAPQASAENVPLPRARPTEQAPEPTAQGALFSWEKPQEAPPAPPPPNQDPGAWQVTKEGAAWGWGEGVRRANLIQSAVNNLIEGKGFAPSQDQVNLQPDPVPPAVQQQLDRKLDLQSAFDPKFWLSRAAVSTGKGAIPMGAGMMGMVGGPMGGALATGVTSGAMSVYPNYQEGLAKGLTPDEAASEALKRSALEGVTDAAGWRLMGMPLFGQKAREEAGIVIGQALKHPFLEAMAQIGLVQPGVGQVRRAGEAAIEGKTYSPSEAITGWAEDVGGGALQMGAFHAAGMGVAKIGTPAMRGAIRLGVESSGLRAELLKDIYRNLEEQPLLVPHFTRFQELVDRHPDQRRAASDWLAEFKESIPDEHLVDLIPHWAVDKNGTIDKGDLTQLIRSKYLDVEVGPHPGSGTNLGLLEPKPLDPTDKVLGRQATYYDRKGPANEPSADFQSYGLTDTWKMGDALRVLRYFAEDGRGSIMFRDGDPAADALLNTADRMGLDRSTFVDRNLVFSPKFHVINLDKKATGVNLGLPFAMSSSLKKGVTVPHPMAAISPEATFRLGKYSTTDLMPAIRLMARMMNEWHGRFKMQYPLEVKWVDEPNETYHGYHRPLADRGQIVVNLGTDPKTGISRMGDVSLIYETFAHEFGHALVYDVARRLGKSDPSRLQAILGQYQDWTMNKAETAFREEMTKTNPQRLAELDTDFNAYRNALARYEQQKMGEMEAALLRDPAVKHHWWAQQLYSGVFKEWTPPGYPMGYWKDFHEWMANQVSRWATTDERPLSDVDRTLWSLGKQIRTINEFMVNTHRIPFTPEQSIQRWLNDFLGQDPWNFKGIYSDAQLDAQAANRAALIAEGGSGNGAPPITPTTGMGRKIASFFGLPTALPAHADKINKFYEWALNLRQLALKNPHVRGLVIYNELVNLRDLTIKSTQERYFKTSKEWEGLGTEQGDHLASVINDYMLQMYRTPTEVAKNVQRAPTPTELNAIFTKYGLSTEGIQVFKNIQDNLRYALERVREYKILESNAISDPAMQAREIENINLKFNKMAGQPYFPRMRFGDHTFTVYSKDNKQLRFETGANEKEIDRIEQEWLKTNLPGEYRVRGLLDKNVTPFFGLPPDLIGAIADKMPGITDLQRQALESLRLDYSPANSFAHRFQRLEKVPGWSKDFKRAFASYGFSFARWMANIEYAPSLLSRIDEVRDSWKAMPAELRDEHGVDKKARDQIANFMSTHYQQLMNPIHDISWLRGLLFHWYLGVSPAKAFINLTQTVMASYPFLASQFGDLKAIGAILKHGKDLRNFYKTGDFSHLDAAMAKGLAEGVREGFLDEGQAIQLGAMTNADNLAPMATLRGGTAGALRKIGEWSSYLFDTAEKYNRRVVFRAAWELAMKNPDVAFVERARQLYPLQYQRLIDRGWDHREASAFTAARNAVEDTQFVYAPYARPRFMWGKKGTLFAFKNFSQNMLFMMGHYPTAGLRSLAILGGLGGLMGLPFAEDVSGLIKGIMYKIFGKDADPDDWVRKFAEDTLGGKVDPDLILHGYSRHGFGMPQIMSMMGLDLGMKRAYPDQPGKLWRGFDMSANIGMGRQLPMDFGSLMKPSKDRSGPILNAVQQSLGAGFGLPLGIYRALTASQYDWNDFKRYESMIPRWMADISKAGRWYAEGAERNPQGNPILKFDAREPTHMAEILGRAMGWNPTRMSEQYDNMRAEAEAKAFWQINQSILLAQYWRSRNDSKERERVIGAIKDFNKNIEGTAARLYRITPEVIHRSMQTRARNAAKQAQGLPTSRKDIPIVQEIRRLHPGASTVGREILQEKEE